MNKDKIKNNISIMQAYLDGKTIQWKHKDFKNKEWVTVDEPTFSFTYYDYRIKPEPLVIKYRRYIYKDPYGFCIFNHHKDSNEPIESIEELYGFYKWIDSDWITEEINV